MRGVTPARLRILLGITIAFGVALPIHAQVPGLDTLKGAVKKKAKATPARDSEKVTRGDDSASPSKQGVDKDAGESSAGKILFSKKPIDPKNPSDLTTTFKAGDSIYGLVRVQKSWRQIFEAKGKSELQMMVRMIIGDANKTNQYVTLTKPELIDGNLLVLDVAPAIDKMTAYSSEDIRWAEAQKRMKIGPHIFTWFLGELEPGKHSITLKIVNFGDDYAVGQFQIEGEDFKPYADLHKQISKVLEEGTKLPEAKKTDKEMETTMRKLCENAGWKDIVRLNIVDKDWWYDRASGGDSAFVSRRMDAAVAAKDTSGDYYYCICTFQQRRLIDGSYGKLELTDTGQKRKIPAKNIDK
jgi:hypothetical protein